MKPRRSSLVPRALRGGRRRDRRRPVRSPVASDPAPREGARRRRVRERPSGAARPRRWSCCRPGKPPLDAVVAGVNTVEDDPNDNSVGLGGLPNEAGVVELDSSVMDGPTGLCGAVAALQNIKNPSKVARKVMEETNHALIVGPGALAFAKAHGFKEEDLLTDDSRQIWLYWRQKHSGNDDWFTGKDVPERIRKIVEDDYLRPTGTVNCDAVDGNGDLAGCTSTSGLAFKIPGRVGDSPIIGAGLYVDNAFGAAGSTGRGEANIITNGSHVVVESLRQGMHPTDACLAACKRVVEFTRAKHLDREGRPARTSR